jgi:FkbM family methyltransferase
MEGSVDAQDRQYFEPFLNLQTKDEVFVDVGSFDGYTSQEFMKRCPDCRSLHILEPEPTNMAKVQARFGDNTKIHYHSYGASDCAQILRFKSGGSASAICDEGELCISVDRIDNLVQEPCTFLKMDIEGGEISALNGASHTISEYHPRLAISVYHKADDLWRIPDLILSFRNDYDVYLRHYTEGITETVMFFIPQR